MTSVATSGRDGRLCPVCASHAPLGNAFCGACGARMPATDSTASEDGLLGRVIDSRFRVLRLLGAGGMGAVYLAEHVGIGKKVAVKVLRADLRSHPELVGRFRREAMAVSRLTDAHTITVFDFGVWKGLIYLVMEYLRGADLAMVLEREGRLDLVRTLRVAHQICSSLAEAHAVGIVHRDLKPENIFVTRTTSGDELVKVLDFGLAKILSPMERPGARFETQDGMLLGTPYFMAPEQVRSERIDQRTDLYALGALMFRMYTGQHPYRGRSPMEVLEGHLSGTLPTLTEMMPGLQVPEPLEDMVRRLMAREASDRPATALEADDSICALLDTLDRPSTRGPAALPSPAPEVVEAQVAEPFPSAFSTSAILDSGEFDPIAPDEPGFSAPTRDEFASYERRLRVKAWLTRLVLAGLVVGGGGLLWWEFDHRPYVPPAYEVEPNDDPAEATHIVAGVSIKGYLGRRRDRDRSDRDVFLVDVPPHRPYVDIRVEGVPGIDLLVEGFDTKGKRLFKHNAAGVSDAEHVLGGRVDRPQLVVVVREMWVQGERPSENSTDPYELVVRFAADPPPNAPHP